MRWSTGCGPRATAVQRLGRRRAAPATISGMTVPVRREAARLLLSLDPPAWSLRHACAVADVAFWLAHAIARSGTPLDVGRGRGRGAAARRGQDRRPVAWRVSATARDLRPGWRTGMGELSPLVRDHPVTRLADDADAARLAAAPSRPGSSPTPTSGPGSGSSPWTSGSPRGAPVPSGPRGPPSGRTTGRRGPGWDDGRPLVVPARCCSSARSGLAGVEPRGVRRQRWSRRALRQAASHSTSREAVPVTVPVIAYYRGGDGFALDRAVVAIARRSSRRRARRRTAGA